MRDAARALGATTRHTSCVERRRVLVEDSRGADRHLRVTWHPEAGQFNASTWHGDVCAGAVRVDPEDAARLIALLSDGMAEAIALAEAAPPSPGGRRWRIWLSRARERAARIAG